MNGSSEEFGGKKMTAPFFYKEKNMIRKCYFKKNYLISSYLLGKILLIENVSTIIEFRTTLVNCMYNICNLYNIINSTTAKKLLFEWSQRSCNTIQV